MLICIFLFLTSCESLRYYSQAASGQLSILRERQAIEKIIIDPESGDQLKSRLALVLELRSFAESELELPVQGQYSHYVDLERDFVVWNVFAAPELSLEPKVWCYPIAGCSAYRGYFSERAAREYAEKLAKRGYDTFVGGVAAYSTLGWLNDPVLNTFFNRDEAQMADLIFHELAHNLLYVPDNTLFNESFATAVAIEGVRRWMLKQNNREQYTRYLESKARQDDFVRLVLRYRERLAFVYDSSSKESEKRQGKDELFGQLRQDFQRLQQHWGDTHIYSAWVAAPINNAKLNSEGLYFELVPGFQNLLAGEGYQLSSFYERCRQLGELNPDVVRSKLESLATAGPS